LDKKAAEKRDHQSFDTLVLALCLRDFRVKSVCVWYALLYIRTYSATVEYRQSAVFVQVSAEGSSKPVLTDRSGQSLRGKR
jgi:hypothetical protein